MLLGFRAVTDPRQLWRLAASNGIAFAKILLVVHRIDCGAPLLHQVDLNLE